MNIIEFNRVINVLLPYIFDYLDYDSLNRASQVCVYWKKLATKLYVTTIEFNFTTIELDWDPYNWDPYKSKRKIIPNWFKDLPIKHR